SLRTIPGVRASAASSGIPFGNGAYTTTPIVTPGRSALPPDTAVPHDWRIVSPGYSQAMNIPVVSGREFLNADTTTTSPLVVIVSQATARRFWGGDDPIGRILHRQGDLARQYTVVGVVGDVRHSTLTLESPAIYYPSFNLSPRMDVVVRTEGAPASVLSAVREKVHQLDPALPVSTVRTMDEWLANSAAQPRLNAVLLVVFAVTAILIAAIGIYGVLAYSVNQRTREIGVRMALGAPRAQVLRMVVREGMIVGAVGVVSGVVAALVVSGVLSSLVYGVEVRDPATYAGVAVILAVVALVACVVPASKASRVDPVVALRFDEGNSSQVGRRRMKHWHVAAGVVVTFGMFLSSAPTRSQTQLPTQGPAVDGSPAWFLQGSFPDPTGRTIVDASGHVTVPPRGSGPGPGPSTNAPPASAVIDTPPCRHSPLCGKRAGIRRQALHRRQWRQTLGWTF